jgi:hypothetical protein
VHVTDAERRHGPSVRADGRAERVPAPVSPTADIGLGGRAIPAWPGIRHPMVAILVLISFFTGISGKPIDGLLILTVATGLAWDGEDPRAGDAGALASGRPARELTGHTRHPRPVLVVGGIACGALYAGVVGSFSRYSWPATVAVISLGTAVVLAGWRGPVRDGPAPGPLPVRGTALWGGLLVVGGSWELSALLQQPNLSVDSYAHPTISSLTDPLLGSHPGRSLALAAWLGIGWLLVRR